MKVKVTAVTTVPSSKSNRFPCSRLPAPVHSLSVVYVRYPSSPRPLISRPTRSLAVSAITGITGIAGIASMALRILRTRCISELYYSLTGPVSISSWAQLDKSPTHDAGKSLTGSTPSRPMLIASPLASTSATICVVQASRRSDSSFSDQLMHPIQLEGLIQAELLTSTADPLAGEICRLAVLLRSLRPLSAQTKTASLTNQTEKVNYPVNSLV